jgi:site-specific recombinase XerD
MTEDMQVRNFSPHTQNSYVQQVSLFARYFSKSPEVLGPEEIRSYQVYLTNAKKLAPSSILIAVYALRFLYKVLHKDWKVEEIIPRPEAPKVADCLESGRSPKVLKRAGIKHPRS